MSLEIRSIPLGGKLGPFLDVARVVYAGDASYVRPLDVDLARRLSPKHPYFQHGRGMCFVALDRGRPVGRITAHTNQLHLDRYGDGVGFFGTFDTVDDGAVASALLGRARDWLKQQGVRRIRGPITMNMAEEVGCLVEGFDTPPMLLMPHHRPYQGGLIEAAGLARTRTMFAWRYEGGNVPARALRGHAEIAALPEVRVRRITQRTLARDVLTLLDIYEDAWKETWGFVPVSDAEARHSASELRMVIVPELTRLIDIDGEPAAFCYALPNVNEAIRDLGGRLSPVGLAKLLYRLKVRGTKTARLVGLGIRSKYRHVRKYAALSAFLYTEMNRSGAALGYEWGELSYTDEANGPVNTGIKMMGGKIYKRYAVYEGDA
jgi:hypothetical protein